MRYDHVDEIMQRYGYQDFSSQPEHFRFLRWLYIRAWWSEERLTVLFDMAHLIDSKILFEIENLDLSFVPRGGVKALARYATTALVHNLRQLAQDRWLATLLAFVSTYLATVHDDALDLFDVLMRMAFSQATRESNKNACARSTTWTPQRRCSPKPVRSSSIVFA